MAKDFYSFQGTPQSSAPKPIVAQRIPTILDDGYPIGQIWIDQPGNASYILTSVNGSANWEAQGAGVGFIETLTGDSGGAISPSGGNIDILGFGTVEVVGTPNTLTITTTAGGYPITPFVVGPVDEAGYQTIQSALDAANAAGGGVVYVQPGTYTEDLTFYDAVHLYGTPAVSQEQGASATIVGIHTPPTSGQMAVNSICFVSTTDAFFSAAAGTAHLAFLNCESNVQDGYFLNVANWTGELEIFDFNAATAGALVPSDDGGINNTGGASVNIFDAYFGNSSTKSMTISGVALSTGSSFGCNINFVTGAEFSFETAEFAAVTCSNDSTGEFSLSSFTAGAASAITMSSSGAVSISECVINSSNTNAIAGAGAGILSIGKNTYTSSKGVAGTLSIDTSTCGAPITPYVVGVGVDATYHTIQEALDAANGGSGGIVYIQPGTYTENLTLYEDVALVGVPGNSDSATTGNTVVIIGVHVPPATGSFSAVNIQFQSATHVFNSAVAGSASIVLENCSIDITNGYTFNLLNWTGALVVYNLGDISTNNGVVNNTGGAECFFVSATLGAGTGNTMVTSGIVEMQEVDLNCPWSAATGSVIECDYNVFTHTVTCANNSTGTFSACRFATGSDSALTMSSSAAISVSECVINSSNVSAIAGAGAGTLSLAGTTFTDSNGLAATLTLSTTPVTMSSGFQTSTLAGRLLMSGAGISANGTDANISIGLTPKGTGSVNCSGNLALTSVATQLQMNGGAVTDFIGTATLAAGTVTVANTNIAAGDRIFIQRQSINGSTAVGELTYSISAATSFTITSVQPGTPASPEANDTSIVAYFIVRQT